MATNENNPCTCTTPEYTIILNQQGPSGKQGATGQNGFSPTIEVVNNDYSNYQLRVTNATSSFTTPNLKANLPSGGNTGQILTKNSNTNGDYVWSNISSEQLSNNILLNNKPIQILNKASIITDQSLQSYIAAIDGIEDESGYCNGALLTPNGLTLGIFLSNGILLGEQGFGLTTKNIQAGENILFRYTEDNPQKLVISGTAKPYELPIATTTTLGGIKVGDGLSITDDGVLSASGGLRYKTLTSTEYEALSTKDADTMYRLTDTNEVYLGTIPLTGGASAQYKTLLINNYANATQTNLGGSTTVQVTDTEV